MICKVMTGLDTKFDNLYELSQDINKYGYKSYVRELPSGAYTVCVLVTRDKEKAKESKDFIEKTFNRKVGLASYDDDL